MVNLNIGNSFVGISALKESLQEVCMGMTARKEGSVWESRIPRSILVHDLLGIEH